MRDGHTVEQWSSEVSSETVVCDTEITISLYGALQVAALSCISLVNKIKSSDCRGGGSGLL